MANFCKCGKRLRRKAIKQCYNCRYGITEVEPVPVEQEMTGSQMIDAIIARCRGTVS